MYSVTRTNASPCCLSILCLLSKELGSFPSEDTKIVLYKALEDCFIFPEQRLLIQLLILDNISLQFHILSYTMVSMLDQNDDEQHTNSCLNSLCLHVLIWLSCFREDWPFGNSCADHWMRSTVDLQWVKPKGSREWMNYNQRKAQERNNVPLLPWYSSSEIPCKDIAVSSRHPFCSTP